VLFRFNLLAMQKAVFIFFTAALIILPVYWRSQINFSNTVIVKQYLNQPAQRDNTLQNKNVITALTKPDSSKLGNSVNNTGNCIAKLKPQLKLSFDVLKEKKIDTVLKKPNKPEIRFNTYAHL
jgi:hypothetical protein